jgi:hypothetical protein
MCNCQECKTDRRIARQVGAPQRRGESCPHKQWDGFLPPHNCKHCERPLQGQGDGRPAELYAGTYNGLCYDCTGRPGSAEQRTIDGRELIVWEYPPAVPSYSRTRERYLARPNCGKCSGRGFVWRTLRDLWRGNVPCGRYRRSCPRCSRLWQTKAERRAERRKRDPEYCAFISRVAAHNRKAERSLARKVSRA